MLAWQYMLPKQPVFVLLNIAIGEIINARLVNIETKINLNFFKQVKPRNQMLTTHAAKLKNQCTKSSRLLYLLLHVIK